jgi:rubrerythrin
MPDEQKETLKALETALQMEIDGKEFYLKASDASKNKLGKDLLKKLAAEEDIHRTVFQGIYDSIKSKRGWPDMKYRGDGGQGLRTIFAVALENMKKHTPALKEELDAVKTGMDLENKTLDFYNARSKKTTLEAEKQLYDALAMQESEHHRVLLDYYEFLKNPAGWYVQKEHTSVDGG